MSASEPLDIKNYIGLTGDTPIRFIASDVDGTLVNDAKSVDPEVVNAVRAARERGIRVAIASGRAWHEMDDVIEAMPCLRYFVCTNGAYVMDKEEQKELVHITLDKTRHHGFSTKINDLWCVCRGLCESRDFRSISCCW